MEDLKTYLIQILYLFLNVDIFNFDQVQHPTLREKMFHPTIKKPIFSTTVGKLSYTNKFLLRPDLSPFKSHKTKNANIMKTLFFFA